MASVLSPILRPVSPGLRGRALWLRWAGFTALGELVGFAAPALAGVLITRAVAGLDGIAGPLLTLLALLAAGSLEGAALGYAQWLVLRRVIPAISWRAWTGATAGAGLLAWLLGMLPNTLHDAAGLGMGALIGLWVLVAPVLLCSIGVAQWLVLRRHVARAWPWAPVNALGWLLGLAATFGGAALIDAATPAALAVAIGVASGALMGLVVGLVTGALLVNIADSR